MATVSIVALVKTTSSHNPYGFLFQRERDLVSTIRESFDSVKVLIHEAGCLLVGSPHTSVSEETCDFSLQFVLVHSATKVLLEKVMDPVEHARNIEHYKSVSLC